MQKNTILFDFDFTLADSSQGIFRCVNYALNKMNLAELDYQTIKNTIGHSLPVTFRMLTNESSLEKEEQFVKHFVKKADEIMNLNTKIFPEVFELLPKLKAKGFKIGIISTKFRYRIEGVLEREKLSTYFDIIVGGEDIKQHKPHPDGLFLAMEKLSVRKEQVLYVGDSIVDAMAAQQADIEFIAVLTGTVNKTDFEKENCLKIIPGLNELLPFI